jgi:NAD-specific glutamate dehydrogenase
VENNWQALAREAFRDDVDWQQRAITISVLQMADAPQDMEARVALWLSSTRDGRALARHAGGNLLPAAPTTPCTRWPTVNCWTWR